MSTAVVSTSAALGRPFVFDDESEPNSPCNPEQSFPPCHPERNGKCAKRISRGVEEPALSLSKGSLSLPSADSRLASVTPASRLAIRPAPEMVPSGIPALDTLTGGLPRGCLTEIYGPASSGRTTVLLAALAAATHRGEFCALVDSTDALDPHSATAAGVDLDRLLWVRCGESSPQRHRDTEKHENQKEGCPISRAPFAREVGPREAEISHTTFDFSRAGSRKNAGAPSLPRSLRQGWEATGEKSSEHRLEQVLRATDLLLESGGFGLIVLDLADLPPQSARRIPLTTWFRFRRAVEHKPTILLAIEQQPIAGSCSSLLLQLQVLSSQFPVLSSNQELRPAHAQLLTGLHINAELIHSRLNRKPSHSITFESKTAWAG